MTDYNFLRNDNISSQHDDRHDTFLQNYSENYSRVKAFQLENHDTNSLTSSKKFAQNITREVNETSSKLHEGMNLGNYILKMNAF